METFQTTISVKSWGCSFIIKKHEIGFRPVYFHSILNAPVIHAVKFFLGEAQ
jgi:hypothetical protein